MTRVLLAGGGTGGHLMPGLAIAEALQALRPDVEPVLVGAERGVEASILPERSYRYHLLPAEPIYRRQWWRNARWPLLLPRLWRASRAVLEAERPSAVVGTGGYAAGPILLAAARGGIPIALQEQNAYPGVTTRWAARWARQIHLGFPEAQGRLRVGPRTEVCALGNPITPPASITRAAARHALGLSDATPAVLVMGGSQGSRAINAVLAQILESNLLPGVAVAWSAGALTFDAYASHHRPPTVQVRPFWDPIAVAYAAVDLVVARAGAMTVAEIAAWGLPSILVPLPTAAADHQSANARALADTGAAIHLVEASLTPERLAEAVRTVLDDAPRRARMAEAARSRARPEASRAIAERLLELL